MDADSEGLEGAFYVWGPEEVVAVLGKEQGEAFCRYYGVRPQDNFERGKSVLYRTEAVAGDFDEATLQSSRQKLLEARNERIRPAIDDKIITGWNGLMISAFAVGYRVFRER
jgi:hypothetical protein